MNFSSKIADNHNKQKICNAINCYYSNEYMSEADYETSARNISQCEYCSYNYERLHDIKELINSELKRFQIKRNVNIKTKFYEVLFMCATGAAFFLMVLYLLVQTKFFIK